MLNPAAIPLPTSGIKCHFQLKMQQTLWLKDLPYYFKNQINLFVNEGITK